MTTNTDDTGWICLALLFVLLALLSAAGCTSPAPGPTGLWMVTTKFTDGHAVVSTCHSERDGRIVICEPPLPFRTPTR